MSSVRRRALGRGLGLAAIVLAVDQATKEIALNALADGPVDLPLGFRLTHVTNEGIAFGLFSGSQGAVIAFTALATLALIAWLARDPGRPWFWAAAGLLIGGAIGNLVDRIRLDAVTDFIDPPSWPAFNIADIAITLGVAALIMSTFRSEEEDAGRQAS